MGPLQGRRSDGSLEVPWMVPPSGTGGSSVGQITVTNSCQAWCTAPASTGVSTREDMEWEDVSIDYDGLKAQFRQKVLQAMAEPEGHAAGRDGDPKSEDNADNLQDHSRSKLRFTKSASKKN